MQRVEEYQPKDHERVFDVKPVGVAYVCEHCYNGDMIASTTDPIIIEGGIPRLRPHYCNNCGAQMMLPKTYPYIEWQEVKEIPDETN